MNPRRAFALAAALLPSAALAQSADTTPSAPPPGSTEAPARDAATPPGSAPPPGSATPPANTASAPPEPTDADLAPPTVTTGIVGRLVDDATGEALIDAPVLVVDTAHRTRTDVDGNYALALPPGTYSVRTYYNLYQPARVSGVVVRRGQATRVDLHLRPSGAAARTQEVVVTARADTGTTATTLEVRRQSASVSDTLSAQDVARSPDATASDALRRVVGASIQDGQYASVRGLGGRYVNVLLNGVPLPSTDPDVPGVQLDLFPAALLNGLTLVKTFTPDMPGDFAGGSLQLATRDYPTRFTFSANVSVGIDSRTHNGPGVLGYRGGETDALGFDDGTRALPAAVPAQRVQADRGGLTDASVADIARSFPDRWNLTRAAALPNLGAGITVGDTVRVGGRPLGYLLSVGYGLTTRRAVGTLRALRVEGGTPEHPELAVRQTFQQESTTEAVAWGALGTVSYQVAPDHTLGAVALWTRATTDYAALRTGYDETIGADAATRQLQYVQRDVLFAQVLGDHRELPGHSRLRWQLFGSYGTRDEPDLRRATYLASPAGYALLTGTGNLVRLYDSLSQVEGGAALDYTLPLGRAVTLRVGGMVRLADRSFALRRFTYEDRGLDPALATRDPETVFAPANLGPALQLVEYTHPLDSYRAITQLYAPFARLDVALGERVRLTGGARVEVFRQWVASRSLFVDPAENTVGGQTRTDRTDADVLPAAAVTWAVTPHMNLRAAYGGTVARPLVRELAPYAFYDFVRARNVSGNPNLLGTFVHNADLRWELFPGAAEVLAVSVFYKRFVNPIESTFDRDGNSQPQNAAGADAVGAELEARFALRRFTPALADFTVGANLALVYSQVALSAANQRAATSTTRPMAGQSPYLANVSVAYAPTGGRVSAQVYYNVFGPRIEDVGLFGLPDVYQDPIHTLDATVSVEPAPGFTLRVAARNLLFQPAVLRQGDQIVQETRPATSFTLRAGWSY